MEESKNNDENNVSLSEDEDEGKIRGWIDTIQYLPGKRSTAGKSAKIYTYSEEHMKAKEVVITDGDGLPLNQMEGVVENVKKEGPKSEFLHKFHSLVYGR